MVTSELAGPRLREITPEGVLRLHLHRGQMRVWNSQARFVFMLAGSQGGKTSLGPHWLHREIKKAEDASPGEGVGDFIAATSTYDQFKLKLLPEMRLVFEDILHIGRYWAGERIIELTEGLKPRGRFLARRADDRMYGRIILRSAEAASGLEASTCRAAWLDEVGQPEFTLDAWEAILRRVALYQGRVLGTTTIYTVGWMKLEVFDRWKAGDPNFDVIQFDSTENPMFPVEEFERARATMPGWKFDMFYRGLYAKPAGLVYDCFDEATQVLDPFPIPPNWLWYVGHDFGGSNPAALAYAQDPGTGLLYLVEEYLPGAMSVHDQVQDLKERLQGRRILRRIGGSHQEQGWRDDYTAQGWPIMEPSVRDVAVGIARVYAWHKRNGIFVFRNNRHYLDEKTSYSYRMGTAYDVEEEIENKSRYHLMDAERYVIGSFPVESVISDAGVHQVRRYRF